MDLPIPYRLRKLPRNKPGYVVPWFVAWIDGEPDFRVADAAKMRTAVADKLCWLCGGKLGRFMSFVVGPMCAVNRTSAEPPAHRDCATYAARVCPFLTTPNMHRRENNQPAGTQKPAGIAILRNPGVALVWTTDGYLPFAVGEGSLFGMFSPTAVEWFAEGRPATRAEVLASIESGLPILRETAEQDGETAISHLEAMVGVAMQLVPADTS